MLHGAAVVAIAGADLDFVQFVEHVQFGNGEIGEAVEHGGHAQHHNVEPAAASRSAGGGTVFASQLADIIAERLIEFRREGSHAYTGGVGLGNAQRPGDFGRPNAQAGAGAAGDGVGRSNVGIGAEIDIQHGALCAFEQHPFAVVDITVDKHRYVFDIGIDALVELDIVVDDLIRVHDIGIIDAFQEFVLAFDVGQQFFFQRGPVQQVDDADAAAVVLVHIGRADAAAGGADLAAAVVPLLGRIQQLVIGHDQMGAMADKEAAADGDALVFQKSDLFHQHHRIDDHTVADVAHRVGMENAAGDLVQNDLVVFHHHGVAGIGSALVAGHHVHLCTQQIDNFPFAFIAPLGADNNSCCHIVL